jgi:hypothetical protein
MRMDITELKREIIKERHEQTDEELEEIKALKNHLTDREKRRKFHSLRKETLYRKIHEECKTVKENKTACTGTRNCLRVTDIQMCFDRIIKRCANDLRSVQ